jgi:hypothetical protein
MEVVLDKQYPVASSVEAAWQVLAKHRCGHCPTAHSPAWRFLQYAAMKAIHSLVQRGMSLDGLRISTQK